MNEFKINKLMRAKMRMMTRDSRMHRAMSMRLNENNNSGEKIYMVIKEIGITF